MDFHTLRVVKFDTSVNEKESENKYIAQHKECKQEDWKSTDETGDEHLCLNDNTSPPRLSKKCLDNKISPPGTSKKYLDDTSSPPRASKYLDDTSSPPRTSKKYPDDKVCPPGKSEKYLDDTTSTSPPETSKKYNFAGSKSKNEIFKVPLPPKSKPRKRDFKINSRDIGLTKLFQDSAHSHQKNRKFNLRNRNSRVHHKVENVKEKKEKTEEVHFLFTRETPSFIKYCKKRTKNERTKNKRDSELPNDFYGFQTSNRSVDQHRCRMSCFNFINTDKIPLKKLKIRLHRKHKLPQAQPVVARNCGCKHHALRVLKSGGEISESSIYYNLFTHSRKSLRKRDNDQEEQLAKDEIVEVSSSSLRPVLKSRRDASTGPRKVDRSVLCLCRPPSVQEKSSATAIDNITTTSEKHKPSLLPVPASTSKPDAAPARNKSKKKRNHMKKTKLITNVPQGFISRFGAHITNFHSNNTGQRSCIEYVVFGLLIVVWSPCLLAVILAWVVMLPLKLTNTLKTDKSRRCRKKDVRSEYQRMCFENYLPKNKKSFMTSATSWYTRTVGTVINTLTSLLKLKKKAPTGAGSSFLPSSYPNPRKRYTLFYADNRGWVMKPLRLRNTRSFASTSVVQSMRCEGRSKFRCPKHSPQKLKKVCGIDSCPRNKLSAAGDAGRLQSPRHWCECWEKYSKGSSIFARHESRYHRRQKVNIPPTFSYPISGIAFNSADKTINAKQFKSNDIADNIAHEDLAKYHLGQRKNETMPLNTKHPLITNLETFRAHKYGLAGKNLNMSKKSTPRLVIKGLQGQLPKCWTKHEAKLLTAEAINKTLGIHRIASFTGVTTSKPKHISSYRHKTKREETLNSPSDKNHKSAIKNKTFHTPQLNFRNKCVLADIPKSTGTKQVNTNTYKTNYAHKTQNTSKHILCHKVTNKPKRAEKPKPDMASKCDKRTQPRQALKYETDKTRVLTQKHSTPAKIKSSIKPDTEINYCFRKKHKQSKQGYKYNPDQIPVATQKQMNTADTTTSTNVDIALNFPCGEKHEQTTQANKNKPHQVLVATQKQSNKPDITTSINLNKTLNYPYGEKHKQSKQANKYKPYQVPVATQKQMNTADTTTSTNVDIALNFPCGEKHEQTTQANKYKPHQVPVATQKQSNKPDITTSVNFNETLNYPYGEKHKQSKQANKYKPYQVPVATQKQMNTADTTTSTNVDIALNFPCGEKHEQTTQANKYKPHEVPVATQKQSNKLDITTSINLNKTLNYPYGEKHKQSKQANKYKPYQVPVATQKQMNTADTTTSTNVDIALNFPCGEKHEQTTQANKYKPHQVPVATQNQSNKPDITTSVNFNETLNYPYGEKHKQSKQANKYKPYQVPVATQKQMNTADTTTSTNVDIALNFPCGEKHEQTTQANKYKPHQVPVATQKQSNKPDITTSVNFNETLNYPYGEKHKQSKQANKYKPYQVPVATQKQMNTADTTTSTNVDIALNFPCGEKHEQTTQANKYKPHQVPVATQKQSNKPDITTSVNFNETLNYPYGEKHKQSKQANKYKPYQVPVATQKQMNTADTTTSTNVDIALNFPCGEMHEQSTQVNKYKPHQLPVATQKQLNTAYITTSTNVDIALNFPCGEKHEQSTQANKYKPHEVPVKTQTQSNKADITISTNLIKTLNYPYGEKHEQSKQCYKYKPDHIPVATQMQSTTADNTTMTNRDIALNSPCEEKHEQHKHCYKYEPHQIPNATQMQSRTADNTTMTNHDLSFNYLGPVKPSTANKKIVCISSTIDTICTQDTSLSESAYKYIPETRKPEQSKQCYKYKPDHIPVTTQMQSTTADNTTMTNHELSFNYLGPVKPSTANKEILCFPSTGDKDTICTQKTSSPEYVTADYGLDTEQNFNTCLRESFSTRRTILANRTENKPTQQPVSHKPSLVGRTLEISRVLTTQPLSTRQLQTDELLNQFQPPANSPLFGMSSDSRYGLAPQKTQALSVQASSSRYKIARDCRCGVTPQIGQVSNPPASKSLLGTDGQPEFSQHLPAVQPDIPKVDKTISKFPKSLEHLPSKVSQAISPVFGIASNCLCSVTPQQYETDKQMKQITMTETKTPDLKKSSETPPTTATDIQELLCDCTRECNSESRLKSDSKKTYTHKTSSAKAPPSQQSKLTQAPSHTLQEQPKLFGVASVCPCRTVTGYKSHTAKETVKSLQEPTDEQPYYTKRNTTKSNLPKSPDHSSSSKYLPRKCRCPVETLLSKSLPHKCRCPVDTLQGPVCEQPYGTKVNTTSSEKNIVKVHKNRSKFPKSPDHLPLPKSLPRQCRCPVETLLPKSLPHKCRCPVDIPQDPEGEQPYGTKVRTTFSERNIVKVDKTRSKFPKLPDHSPPPMSLPRKCRCPVETLQPKSLPHKCRSPVDTLHDPVGEQLYGTKVRTTSSERNIVKVDNTRSKFSKLPDHSPPPMSLPRKCRCPVETLQPKSLPHKCRSPVDTLHDPVGEQLYGTKVRTTSSERNIVKVDNTRSKFSKSPDHPQKYLPHNFLCPVETLLHECQCPVENLQDPVGEPPYTTKVSTTPSKRNSVKIDETLSKFSHLREHSPSQKNLFYNCACPVETLQDTVVIKPSQTSRKSVFSRKSKRKSLDFPQRCPMSPSHNNIDKRCFQSGISVLLRNTTRQFSFRSCVRAEGTCSVNEPSSRVQYRSKVSRLVMSLCSKLFSRKISKQTKIPENPTEKPRSLIYSSLQPVKPKKVDKSHTRLLRHGQQPKISQHSTFSPYLCNTSCHLCHCPNDDTEKTSLHTRKQLDDELNRSFFRGSHIMSKTSQNPSLAAHSSRSMFHSSRSCVIHHRFSKQCKKKYRSKRKPLLVDTSYSCLHVSKTSQRTSLLSHSSKLECRCHADNTSSLRLSKISCYSYPSYPRLSQRIRIQQSKTSEHSSTSDETFSNSKDGMSQKILKTLFMRNSHSKSQQLPSQRNRSQLSAYFNRSQETLSEKQSILTQCLSLSHTMLPGMCRCAAKHLGKTTSRQSNSRPQQLPYDQHVNLSQKPTSAQKQSFKKFDPQYSSSLNKYQATPTAKQTVPSQQTQSSVPRKSKRSSLFNRSQSKLLVEKIESIINDIISSNSRKQENTSSNVGAQTAQIFASKCTCWPEKLQELSNKLSQLSRKSVEKISPSETPPNLLSAQPTPPDKTSNKREITSTLGAQTAPIIQSKCWPEKLHQISKKISQHSRKSVDKTTPSKPPPHSLSAQSTQPDQNSHQTRVATEAQAENPQRLSIRQLKVFIKSRQPEFFQHLPSVSVQPNILKLDSLHCSSQSKQLTEKVEKQFDAIPQQPKAEQIIISGKCRCAGEQKIKTEYSSSNKLQQIQPPHSPNSHSLLTDTRFQSPTASYPTRKSTLGTDKQPKFSQHLPNQPLETPTSKLSQPHPSQQTDIPHSAPLHNSQPKFKKPYKLYPSPKLGNDEQKLPKSLHKIANAQCPGMSHYATEKFQKSCLISCVPVTAKKKRSKHVIIQQRSEMSQSSENPQFQPNPQIQVYQQNLQYQKLLSQIPTNLDKPTPGLLQQSPGLGGTGTAEGGVQHSYPDFNRVSMRYPDHNPRRKRSEPILGLNRRRPTNKYPSAPGATPPPKQVWKPCYINQANQCAAKSRYDESALRRAYKRRPLRCTPSQQLSRVLMKNKLRENRRKAVATRNRKSKRSRNKNFFQCLRHLINQTEREVWPNEISCYPLWLNALKRRPCFRIYKMCPRMYPAFLDLYKIQQYVGQICVYILTLCFWSPLILCGYYCCKGCSG